MPAATLSPAASSPGILSAAPQPSIEVGSVEFTSGSHLADQRLAALVDELADRDHRHLAEAATRRPVLWLLAMTASAIVLAQLAVSIAVAPF